MQTGRLRAYQSAATTLVVPYSIYSLQPMSPGFDQRRLLVLHLSALPYRKGLGQRPELYRSRHRKKQI